MKAQQGTAQASLAERTYTILNPASLQKTQIHRREAEMTALGRVGQPDDIGPMIAALLSEDNRWVNGQRIEVSGGMAL